VCVCVCVHAYASGMLLYQAYLDFKHTVAIGGAPRRHFQRISVLFPRDRLINVLYKNPF